MFRMFDPFHLLSGSGTDRSAYITFTRTHILLGQAPPVWTSYKGACLTTDSVLFIESIHFAVQTEARKQVGMKSLDNRLSVVA